MGMYRLSATHYVVDRSDMFEARVRLVNGEMAAEWRTITVSQKQAKYGGFTPRGPWKPCKAEMIE